MEGLVPGEARLPETQKEASLHPRLEAVVGRGIRTQPRGRERVPLAARAQDKEDGIGTHPVGHPRAAPPLGLGFPCRQSSGFSSAQSSGLTVERPPVLAMRLAWGRVRGLGSGVLTRFTFFICVGRSFPSHYSDRQ